MRRSSRAPRRRPPGSSRPRRRTEPAMTTRSSMREAKTIALPPHSRRARRRTRLRHRGDCDARRLERLRVRSGDVPGGTVRHRRERSTAPPSRATRRGRRGDAAASPSRPTAMVPGTHDYALFSVKTANPSVAGTLQLNVGTPGGTGLATYLTLRGAHDRGHHVQRPTTYPAGTAVVADGSAISTAKGPARRRSRRTADARSTTASR